jgi:subtilisin family serine protease
MTSILPRARFTNHLAAVQPERTPERTPERIPVVAVFDGGVDYTHPDLDDSMWVNPGEVAGNGLDDDGNGVVDDVHGFNVGDGSGDPLRGAGVAHGTHVAGLIGAEDNGVGVTGLAAGHARILSLGGVYGGEGNALTRFERGVDYLVRMKRDFGVDIRVVNMSFGMEYPNPAHQARWKAGLQRLADLDVLVVCAASNERGRNMNDVPHYPSAAGLPNLLTVAGLNSREDGLAYLSAYGDRAVDLAAPSSFLESTTPGGGTSMGQGNSLAAPLVAAAAARLWALRPELSAAEVKALLLSTARRLPSLEGKVRSAAKLDLDAALAALPA